LSSSSSNCDSSSPTQRGRRSVSSFQRSPTKSPSSIHQHSTANSSHDDNDLCYYYGSKTSDNLKDNYAIVNDLEILGIRNYSRDELNIDYNSWLSEKDISVLQLDQADRAVLQIADQRDKIQKKTFTKWINQFLVRHNENKLEINELFEDLRDGHNLITLLEVLSQQNLVSL
jgi:hypothetical protein